MIFSKELQCTLDIDWYGVDDEGNIGHFTSGGGLIPTSIANFKEDTSMVNNFFRNKSLPVYESKLSNVVENKILSMSKSESNRYVYDFKFMSSKGLFSYDKCELGNFSNRSYYQFAIPLNKIHVSSLPKEIAVVINRTQFKGNFADLLQISIDDY